MPESEPDKSKNSIEAAARSNVEKAPEKPDLKTRLEEVSYELSQAKTQLAKAKVRSLEQDIEERKKYAAHIFKLICWWVIGLFVLLLLTGWGRALRFTLSQPVLLAIVGSTTLNVLGLFYIVAHYLFPDKAQRLSEAELKSHDSEGTH